MPVNCHLSDILAGGGGAAKLLEGRTTGKNWKPQTRSSQLAREGGSQPSRRVGGTNEKGMSS